MEMEGRETGMVRGGLTLIQRGRESKRDKSIININNQHFIFLDR